MAVCKALHENDVVLYHPLNDFVEQTQTQTWTGSTQFVNGIVGSGVSAINTFTSQLGPKVAIPNAVNFNTTKFGATKSSVIWLTDTLIAILYNTVSDTIVRTVTVSGTTMTGFNPAVNLSTRALFGLAITKLSASQFVVGWSEGGNRHYRAGTVDASGSIVLGPLATIMTIGTRGLGGPSVRLDTTRFISSVVNGFQYDMFVGQVVGSGSNATITIGALQHTGTNGRRGRNPSFSAWPSSIDNPIVSGVYFWEPMPLGTVRLPNIMEATQYSVSGLTITTLSSVQTNAVFEDRQNGGMNIGFPNDAFALTDDVVMLNYTSFNGFGGTTRDAVMIGRVGSSGEMTFTDPILNSTTLGTGRAQWVLATKVGKETDQSLDIHLHNSDTNLGISNIKIFSRPGSVPPLSGGIQFGSPLFVFPFRVGRFDGMGPVSHFNNGDSRVFLGQEQINNVSGVIFGLGATSNSVLTSPSGTAYPSVSTSTRMTFSVWMRDTLMTGGSFKLGRSFEVTVNPTNIVLNPSGLTWNVSLSSILNDGNKHLLLLDFEHTTAGQWRLRTSIDGVAWVDRGLQLFGVLPVGIVDTTPEITMNNSQLDLGRWIDEAIIWKDTTLFTNQELLNLHKLGSTLNAQQCDYLVHFPFLSNANSTLSMTGFIPAPLPTDPIPHNDMTSLAMFGDTKDNVEGDDQEEELHKLHHRLEEMEDLFGKERKKRNKRRKRKRQRDKHKEKKNKDKIKI